MKLALFTLSSELIETILKYSGIAGVILLFLYLIFQETLKRKLFATLSQKRRLIVLVLTPFLIWSIGVLIIVFDYIKHIPKTEIGKHFIYQGQIVDDRGMPLANAYAYIIFGTDTINAETVTGADGHFSIKLDTTEGIKTTLHYGHAEYGMNTVFRALSASTTEQLVLKKKDTPNTFYIGSPYQEIGTAIEQASSMKYSVLNPAHRIELRYDRAGLDSFEGRWRYLGGKLLVYIDGALCCSSSHNIKATHAAGTSLKVVEEQIAKMMREIFLEEKSFFVTNIAGCLGSHS